MARIFKIFVVMSLFLLVQIAFGNELNHLSYLGSQWHKDGLLPYEQCNIVSDEGSKAYFSGTVGVVVGLTPYYPQQTFYLHCSTGDPEAYSYLIPVDISHIFHFGIMVELTRLGTSEFAVKNLKNKRVSDLFGTYRGIGAGIALIAGKKVGIMKNSSSIQIRFNNENLGWFGISLAYNSMDLEPAGNYLITKDENGRKKLLKNISDYQFVKIKSDQSVKNNSYNEL